MSPEFCLGEVVAGYLGSQERLEFTVIGAAVNVTARIESKTIHPMPPILMSSDFARCVEESFPVYLVGDVALKGVSVPIALYGHGHAMSSK